MSGRFCHVGMTVSDLNRTAAFYCGYFGFERLGDTGLFSEEFVASHRALYRQAEGASSNFCFLKAKDGFLIELFEFHPLEAAKPAIWNRPGFHHICLKVQDISKLYDTMRADGVKFFFPPENRAQPTEHWVFLEDPDGNLIELQD